MGIALQQQSDTPAESQRLNDLLSVWQATRADGALVPRKADLDPVRLASARLLPSVWLVQRVGDDFAFRLCGEQILRNYPFSIKDKFITDVFESRTAATLLRQYRRVVENPAVEFSEGPVTGTSGLIYQARRLMLPLIGPSGAIDYVLGGVHRLQPTRCYRADSVPQFNDTRVLTVPVGTINDDTRLADLDPVYELAA